MKTNISKIVLGTFLASSVLMSGCIDEVIPTSMATEDQVTSSDMAAEAMLWAMPASMNQVAIVSKDWHFDWGYGSVMHIRDVMTGDMPIVSSGYDWYSPWEENVSQAESNSYPQFIWNYYWNSVLTANKLLASFDEETASEIQQGYMGAAYAYRAHFYLDMARMFEYLPTDVTSGINKAGNDVTNLTVPIVTEKMSEQEARNNPRVTREKMAEFILGDLTNAERLIGKLNISDNVLPHLDVVQGLRARCYMWLEDYANAKKYAREAIKEASIVPMTEEQCLSTSKGFNDISRWMWGCQLVAEDASVKTGILNWVSWMSNETSFGYSAQEPYLMIDARMYNRISDTDFRKKLWKAPEGSALDGATAFLTSTEFGYFGDRLSAYSSVKFRPGEGNPDVPSTGAVSAYPLMRVEEMYFIEAEAAAHLSDAEGRKLLQDFMINYRDEKYSTNLSGEELIDEIVFQKRVEQWGEGLTFFDIKRLDMPVERAYTGTNFSDAVRFNTTRRPAWMNISIVQTEKNNNKALIGYENPDPSDKYEVIKK
nr:RagB/SusD family nutrient uptake outer membrane protein [uncultured Bacteroides sp.]